MCGTTSPLASRTLLAGSSSCLQRSFGGKWSVSESPDLNILEEFSRGSNQSRNLGIFSCRVASRAPLRAALVRGAHAQWVWAGLLTACKHVECQTWAFKSASIHQCLLMSLLFLKKLYRMWFQNYVKERIKKKKAYIKYQGGLILLSLSLCLLMLEICCGKTDFR